MAHVLSNMSKILNLSLLIWTITTAYGQENEIPETFAEDIIDAWQLLSPTIIVQDFFPKTCTERPWVLCLSDSMDTEDLALHLNMIYQLRKQDGLIFIGSRAHEKLVKQLAQISPFIFSSNCPVFMPIEYGKHIELRLDSNILFYKKVSESEYTLLDKFGVKGGSPVTQELGSWNKDAGLELRASKFRWNRRTDLNGAVFINTLKFYKNYAEPLYDSQGNVVGSEGSHQARVHAFAESMNLNIETLLVFDNEFGKILENGTWTGCVGMLTRNHADACSTGLAWTISRNTAIDFSDALTVPNDRYTLMGPITREKVLDMWVYIGVFGFAQWGVFIGCLLTVLLGFLLTSSFTDGTEKGLVERVASGMSMVMLYTIQMGDQPEGGSAARRILQLTMAILAFMIFVFYTSDITAQMTSTANLANPIASFEDVLQNTDIQVIVVEGSSWAALMKNAKPGTAKLKVYKTTIENNDAAWYSTIEAAKDAALSNPNTYLYGYSTAAKDTPGLMALRMVDSSPGMGGIGLKKNSEFTDILKYKTLKLAEGGILKRVDKTWPDTSRNEDFGMIEPTALEFKNLLFPFTMLAAGMMTALASASIEYMIQFVIRRFEVGHQVKKMVNGKLI